MKSTTRRMIAHAVILGAFWTAAVTARGEDAEERAAAAAAARAKDPVWKPSTTEVGLIQVGDDKTPGALQNFCLNSEGNILACFAPTETPAAKSGAANSSAGIRVYSPKGELLKTLPLDINPCAICVAKDGSIFVAGGGKVLKLDATGKVLASAVSPGANEPVTIPEEMEEMLRQSGRPIEEEIKKLKTKMEQRRADATGLATTEQDVFMAVGAPNDFTYRVYRWDHALQNPKLVVEKLRGCCGQMDIQANDGKLWIPHNGRKSVESRDRDGNQLMKFGKSGKIKATDFGGCCEPKNMRVLSNGDILVAESGPPTCIKRFSASGKFMEVVAVAADAAGDCVRVTVEMSPDGKTFYMMDTTRDAIRVFGKKG